ncbi:MAG: hypothetical protein ACSLFD_06440 [Solirubrobacterales bacterium]
MSADWHEFLASQILQGAARALFWTCAHTHAARTAGSPARILAAIMLASGFSYILGPLLAGLLMRFSLLGSWERLARTGEPIRAARAAGDDIASASTFRAAAMFAAPPGNRCPDHRLAGSEPSSSRLARSWQSRVARSPALRANTVQKSGQGPHKQAE